MLSFELTMPNVGSWNGKWTGDGRTYFRTRKVDRKKENELDEQNFYYDFGDGWGASVKVEKINAREAARRRRKSAGFFGYDWMIDEILQHGKILSIKERRDLTNDYNNLETRAAN